MGICLSHIWGHLYFPWDFDCAKEHCIDRHFDSGDYLACGILGFWVQLMHVSTLQEVMNPPGSGSLDSARPPKLKGRYPLFLRTKPYSCPEAKQADNLEPRPSGTGF